MPGASVGRSGATSNIKSTAISRNGGSSGGTDAEDISVAISKLTYSVEDVEKQLKNVVRDWPSFFEILLSPTKS